jgi:hypothetical protein
MNGAAARETAVPARLGQVKPGFLAANRGFVMQDGPVRPCRATHPELPFVADR